MRKVVILIACIVGFAACQEEEQFHLPHEKMVDVLTDVHFAEVYSTMVNDTSLHTTNKNIDSLAVYYRSITKSHDITLDEYKSSLSWYMEHPKEMDAVYASMLERISAIEGNISAENKN